MKIAFLGFTGLYGMGVHEGVNAALMVAWLELISSNGLKLS